MFSCKYYVYFPRLLCTSFSVLFLVFPHDGWGKNGDKYMGGNKNL